jgi:hypothetical protein
MLKLHGLRTNLLFLLVLSCIGAAPGTDGNMCAIEKAVIHHMRPAGVINPPIITRIAIEDEYAVALWVEGYAGGTAVLRERTNAWAVLSEGGGWNSVKGLMEDGIPQRPLRN